MKKIAITLLLVLVTLSSTISSYAEKDTSSELSGSGIVVSVDKFNELYGTPDSSPDILKNLEKNAEIKIDSVDLHENNLRLNANISYGNQEYEMFAEGYLYNSYKRQDFINSVVGDLKDRNGNFEILLFDIYNDSSPDKVITSQEYEQTPHLKLYLTDNKGNILLFELDIPEKLRTISIDSDERIATEKDFFWFINVIKPFEDKEIPTNEKLMNQLGVQKSIISPNAVGYFSDWTHTTTYYKSFYIGSDYVQAWSLPYGSWKALDVNNQSTWTNSFKIAEHVTINGTTNRNVDNPFRYRNVKLSTGVGAKSTIVNAIVDGRLSGYSTGSSLVMKIAEKAWSTALPALPSISEITGWINAIIDTGTNKTIKLGTTNIKLNSNPTVVESANSGNHQMFKYTDISGANTGHHLLLQTTVQYESSTGTSATANGVMKAKWDVYYDGLLYNSSSKDVSFKYNVSK
ncbi:hypothetical protein MKX64_11100 [Paenibacillus sp. FSL M8-0334]|uniref:Uncharacterized protein n=1 Tax=Paenibacillus campinasensis TaxID=66347 RepID=A0ABW9T3G2_9BACL|nr:hypothetical protein [Paenibacillus campinasensis]MUG67824.1 hypothetical protein [Paenibacillus campinasensis]PAK48602.1 hypothetical protein CHH75_22480 [Paenibacillus sp. 7541]